MQIAVEYLLHYSSTYSVLSFSFVKVSDLKYLFVLKCLSGLLQRSV